MTDEAATLSPPVSARAEARVVSCASAQARGWGVGRRSDALAVTIARNTCRRTLKTLIQRPGPLPRLNPGSSPGCRRTLQRARSVPAH